MQARRDENRVTTLIGESSADGRTLINVKAEPAGHAVQVSDGLTGNDYSDEPVERDENRVTGMLAVSSADGVTPTPIYVTPNGELLIQNF